MKKKALRIHSMLCPCRAAADTPRARRNGAGRQLGSFFWAVASRSNWFPGRAPALRLRLPGATFRRLVRWSCAGDAPCVGDLELHQLFEPLPPQRSPEFRTQRPGTKFSATGLRCSGERSSTTQPTARGERCGVSAAPGPFDLIAIFRVLRVFCRFQVFRNLTTPGPWELLC